MHFYTVKEEYLDLLRAVDSKVPNSSGDNYKGKKPFIGVVLQIGGHNFFAPLTSYKASQEKIKSSSCTALNCMKEVILTTSLASSLSTTCFLFLKMHWNASILKVKRRSTRG